eukprot:348063-Pyramimonas_sp.AAC.2
MKWWQCAKSGSMPTDSLGFVVSPRPHRQLKGPVLLDARQKLSVTTQCAMDMIAHSALQVRGLAGPRIWVSIQPLPQRVFSR